MYYLFNDLTQAKSKTRRQLNSIQASIHLTHPVKSQTFKIKACNIKTTIQHFLGLLSGLLGSHPQTILYLSIECLNLPTRFDLPVSC